MFSRLTFQYLIMAQKTPSLRRINHCQMNVSIVKWNMNGRWSRWICVEADDRTDGSCVIISGTLEVKFRDKLFAYFHRRFVQLVFVERDVGGNQYRSCRYEMRLFKDKNHSRSTCSSFVIDPESMDCNATNHSSTKRPFWLRFHSLSLSLSICPFLISNAIHTPQFRVFGRWNLSTFQCANGIWTRFMAFCATPFTAAIDCFFESEYLYRIYGRTTSKPVGSLGVGHDGFSQFEPFKSSRSRYGRGGGGVLCFGVDSVQRVQWQQLSL